MKHQNKLSREQRNEAGARQTAERAGLEFADAEALLRSDAAQTDVPPEIEQRLKKDVRDFPPSRPRPWWRNLFGR